MKIFVNRDFTSDYLESFYFHYFRIFGEHSAGYLSLLYQILSTSLERDEAHRGKQSVINDVKLLVVNSFVTTCLKTRVTSGTEFKCYLKSCTSKYVYVFTSGEIFFDSSYGRGYKRDTICNYPDLGYSLRKQLLIGFLTLFQGPFL